MQLDNMLIQACKNNQKGVVQTFLKRGGVDLNKRDESGNTPLIYACMKNSREIVKLLLENGADYNEIYEAKDVDSQQSQSRGYATVADKLRYVMVPLDSREYGYKI